MRSPKDFFQPLSLGAPMPVREIPVRPSRMIHFFDPSNPKMVAKVPDIAPKVDVLLGNLEDAIQASNKDAARAGLIEVAKTWNHEGTQLWTRINSLDSPWCLDDLFGLVTEIGDKLDVIMVPKVEGPEEHPLHRQAAGPARSPRWDHKTDSRARAPRDGERRCQRRGDLWSPARECRVCRLVQPTWLRIAV